MKLLLATTNEGKVREYRHLLKDFPFELITIKDLNITEKVEETEETFEENAVLKAREYCKKSNILTLADDGGLEIDYLGGEPGVKSRRWPGYEASDDELIELALQKLKGVPREKRTARFRVVIAVALNPEDIRTFSASLEGYITESPVYPIIKGYPFRSIFYCPEAGGVLANFTVEEVHNLHRKRALEQSMPLLQNLK